MSKRRPPYIPENQWIEDLPSYVLRAAYQYLPLGSFGFRETYRDDTDVILNSEWCRIDFHVSWELHPYNHHTVLYELSIYYGRLHASSRDVSMLWHGEKCKCWLDTTWNYPLEYINYAFPERQRLAREDIVEKFLEKRGEFSDSIHIRLAYEAEIWKHYTPELFELFDLRRPELWEQYRAWLKARYIAEGRSEAEDEKKGLIPYYRVC